MPPRKRKATPPPPAHRAQLERDLEELELTDRRALSDLARALADDLDQPPASCEECGGRSGPDPRIVARYLEALEALGIGSLPPKPERDTFRDMLVEFAEEARRRANG